jgi:hypothetical protein
VPNPINKIPSIQSQLLQGQSPTVLLPNFVNPVPSITSPHSNNIGIYNQNPQNSFFTNMNGQNGQNSNFVYNMPNNSGMVLPYSSNSSSSAGIPPIFPNMPIPPIFGESKILFTNPTQPQTSLFGSSSNSNSLSSNPRQKEDRNKRNKAIRIS